MADSEVKIRISADSTQAVTGIDNVGRRMKQFESDSDGIVRTLQAHWLKVSAAIAGVAIVANKAWDMAYATAQFEQSRAAFNSMVNSMGADADRLFAQLREKSANLIDQKSLVESANRAMSLGIPVEKLGELMEVARAKARDMGITTTQAFNDIATGVGRASPLILDNLGLVIKVGEANQRMADELHKNVSALTEKEKKIAILNAALDSGKEALGRYNMAQNTTLENMQRVSAAAKDMSLMLGQVLLRAVSGVAGAFQWLAAGAMGLVSYLVRGVQYLAAFAAKIYELTGQTDRMKAMREEMESWKRLADDMQGAAGELTGKAVDKFGVMLAGTQELAAATGEPKRPMVETRDHTVAAADAVDQLTKRWQQMSMVLQGDIAKEGLDAFESRLIDIQTRAEQMKEQFKDLPAEMRKAAYATIDAWAESQTGELVTQAAQRDFDLRMRMEEELQRIKEERFDAELAFYEMSGNDATRLHELRLEQIEREAQAWRDAGIDRVEVEKWVHAETVKLNTERAQSNIGHIKNALGYTADMFESLSQLYDKDSSERKKLHDLSMAFNLAEKAATTAQIILEATKAVATQGSGDPYTAFARVAAMAASMAALLASVGIAFSGSGGGSGAAAAQGPAMGNSTVLGAAYGTASESLSKSFELLQETYELEDVKLTKIYNELRDLNSNLTGLVSTYIRTGGINEFLGTLGGGSSYQAQSRSKLGIGMGAAGFLSDPLTGSILSTIGLGINTLTNQQQGKILSSAIGLGSGDPFTAITHMLLEKLTGGALGKNIGKFLNSVFGGQTQVGAYSAGVKLEQSSIAQILSSGIMSRQYADMFMKQEGGWFGKDKAAVWREYDDLDSGVSNLFTKIYQNLGNTLVGIAENLGTDVNDVLEYQFKSIKINMMGKNGEEISKLLSEKFSAMGDDAVEALFGDVLSKYQEINEGLLETAVRLITDKESVLNILKYTNQAFDGTTSELLTFSEALIDVAGSLEDLTEAFQTYYDAFFSDAEKQEMLKRQLTEILGSYGLDLPGTRAGYRELVESLDRTTDAGIRAYAALIDLASGADQYYDYLEQRRANVRESDYATRVEYERAVRGYAGGGYHSGGYRIVGEYGPELERTGPSTIYSTSDSRKALGTDDLIASVEKLRAEVGEANFSIASTQLKLAKLLDKWDGEGMPAERT